MASGSRLQSVGPARGQPQGTTAPARALAPTTWLTFWPRAISRRERLQSRPCACQLLAWTYYAEWDWHWNRDPQTLERMFDLAQRALVLDDSMPIAHSLWGWTYAQHQQYDRAIAEGERAIALGPNNADSYAWQSEMLGYAGRPEEALKSVKQAIRLNPRYPSWYLIELGWAGRDTGRYAEAIAALTELISRNPDFLTAHTVLGSIYLLQWASQ